jgi:D-arabinitol dehydrogenase (NADP+)
MKAGKIYAPQQIGFDAHSAEPACGPDDVLIRVRSAGICGTDVHIVQGEYEAQYPLIPGHEFSGDVVAVGEGVQRFKVGDRVTADPNVPCGRCAFCQRNEPNQCRHLQAVGVTRDGGFAEYVSVTEGNVFPIGDLSYKAAALIEPLACVVWGLQRVEVQPGSRAMIFGAGPMGCLLAQAVKASGAAEVVVVDRSEWRLELLRKLGGYQTVLAADLPQAQLAEEGYDLVADATGVPSVMESMFAHVRPRGTVWIFGVAPNGSRMSVPPYEVFRKDLKIIGSFAVNRTFPQAITLIQSGAVQVEPLVSHVLPLEEFVRGFDLAQHDPGRMKLQFEIT